jgi:hypothetical protein
MEIEKPVFRFIIPDFSKKTDAEKLKICVSCIKAICFDISLVAAQLGDLENDKEWNQEANSAQEFAMQMGYGTNLCQFHHENLLYRKYAIRERIYLPPKTRPCAK